MVGRCPTIPHPGDATITMLVSLVRCGVDTLFFKETSSWLIKPVVAIDDKSNFQHHSEKRYIL